MAEYDEREEELSSIAAIFPELVVDANDSFAASIDLPVTPSAPLTVRFSAAPLPSPPDSDDGKTTYAAALNSTTPTAAKDEHKLDHLPPLHLNIVLPTGYPEDKAPRVTLSTSPEWLPEDRLRQLSEDVERLWEEYGRCQILFSYIDHLQQSADTVFDLVETGLDLPPTLKPALLDFDAATRKAVFDGQTFDCGVCLEPKKGSECYRLRRCGHVFCRSCLQDAYNHFILEGDVIHVCCLDPTCGKDSSAPRKRKTQRTLHPRELLDMSIAEPTVRRYVEMKRKKKLEADKNTVYCPRSWCQAPARSAKYPALPADLRLYPDSDSESEVEGAPDSDPTAVDAPPPKQGSSTADRLCICSKCTLAFCRICYSTWHGDFARCWPRNPSELTDEEKASYDYIRLNTSPCPTCSSPVQKTMGCNHMTCFQCQTHFCYLCGAWLDGSNPYQHFNRGGSSCYQRLWELEEGDEGQAAGFAGGRMWEQEARRVAEEADREEAERLQDEENEHGVLMDAENEGLPLRLNGPQIEQLQMLPEAPAPPPQQMEPALAAQFAQLQMQIPIPLDQARRPNQNPFFPRVEPGRGRGRGAARNVAEGPRGNGRRPRGGGHIPHPPNQNARPAHAHNRGRGGAQVAGQQARAPAPQQVRNPPPPQPPQPVDEEAAAAAFRRFVELAARDQEEEWDSDELDDDNDDGRWEIRPRVRQQEQAFAR